MVYDTTVSESCKLDDITDKIMMASLLCKFELNDIANIMTVCHLYLKVAMSISRNALGHRLVVAIDIGMPGGEREKSCL